MTTGLVLTGLLVVVLCVAVATDVRWRLIPDWLTWPSIALALAARFWLEQVGDPERGLVSGLIGVALAAGWFGVFALRGQLGWGDVKLAAVVGACLGFPRAGAALLFISLAGALQAVVSLLWQGAFAATMRNVLARSPEKGDAASRHIPYGVAIALGSLGALWWDGNAF